MDRSGEVDSERAEERRAVKNVVIFHRADFDGLFCEQIARKFLPEDTGFYGWDYGDRVPVTDWYNFERVYMLDISIEPLMTLPNLIWIDHHKSAMEKFGNLQGYQIDGVAACRLAWQWFTAKAPLGHLTVFKEAYVNRTVSEPLAVRLAGEYDIWDKRDPDAELFQHGLRSCDLSQLWDAMLSNPLDENGMATVINGTVLELLDSGRAIQYAKTQENSGIITSYGFTLKFDGLTFLACNHARFNSHLFTAGIKPEHDALLGFNYDGEGNWRVSLYHAPGKEHHDLSLIAVKHGGGGHKGACGFRVENLWHLLENP